jgi:hypothetical protein
MSRRQTFLPGIFERRRRKNRLFAKERLTAFLWMVAAVLSPPVARAANANTVLKIPPVNIPLNIKDQPITITAAATLTLSSRDQNLRVLKLELTGDLSDLQRNLTGLLGSILDKDDRCGDLIAIQSATLAPAEPASLAVVKLHFERRACIKVFGKQESKKLISGNAQIQIKLTPEVEMNSTELRLSADVGDIQADGSLGSLLRSGPLGNTIREKIQSAILSALQKGTDLHASLPAVAQPYATIQNAEFKDAGSGSLAVVLDGEVRLTQEQLQALANQVKERFASR